MANRKALTASNIRYLLTMIKLDQAGKGVRCVDIATNLGLSKPSVHNMMDTLVQMGFVNRNTYGVAFFTDAGYSIAREYSRYYEQVSKILKVNFPDLDDVQTVACFLLAEIPQTGLEKMCSEGKMTFKS